MDLYIKHSNFSSTRQEMENGIIKDLLDSQELSSDFILISRYFSNNDDSSSEKRPENYVLECINDKLSAYSKIKYPDNPDKWL